jgi:hypothetical protein
MGRRKNLLLCSAPAALALAALVWALARDGRCEAERRAERVREEMTLDPSVEAILEGGPDTTADRRALLPRTSAVALRAT